MLDAKLMEMLVKLAYGSDVYKWDVIKIFKSISGTTELFVK